MIYLKQSTASQEVPLGYFVDSTDGNTEVTGLTIANTDIKVWKTGATTLASKNSGGGTHISNGVYYAVLDATDTDTIGPLVLFVHVAGALAVRLECCVLASGLYDWMFGTTAPLTPTVAGRTLDVSAGGEAGVDWANVGSPTTTVGLSGTTVKTATDVETDTADIQSRLPASLVSGRIDASVGAMASDVITNTALAGSAVTEIQSGLSTLTGADVRTAVGLATANLDTQLDTLPTALEIATEVWGTNLTTDGAVSDLLITTLDATISSRLSGADYTEPDNASITAIKAKTDNLPSDPADASVIAGRFDTLDASVATVDGNVDAIKAKTDSLTFTVAGNVDVNIQRVNDVAVTGTGAAGDEWGP